MSNKSKLSSLRSNNLILQENVSAYLFLLPFLIFFVGFVLYPMFMCLYTSFFDATMGRKDIFIGFQNYKELASDPVFWVALKNTMVIVLVSVPVTCKIRKGFDENSINAEEIAHIAQESGAAAVTVHARTREQYYSGKADWSVIQEVKEAVRIPVFGNGDVFTPQDAERMFAQTGCDGVMIARGSKGNPWIFAQLKAYFDQGVILPQPTFEEMTQMLLKHAKMQCDLKGEFAGMREMRKHIQWYTGGYPHSSKLRQVSAEVKTYADLQRLILRWQEMLQKM